MDRASRKKYTRSELFNVAERMKDNHIDREQLDRFRENRLIFERRECEFDSLHLRPRPLERAVSNQQSLERKLSSQLRVPQRISRMTSSPSLKYNKNYQLGTDMDERMMMKGDPISSQAKAKYAELIENLGAHSIASRTRLPASRTSSLNAWQSDEQRRNSERPAILFSPVRRETNRQQDRRDSDEPLSLPYVLTNTSSSGKNSLRSMASDMDSFSHSSMRRIGSFGSGVATAGNNQDHNEAEDDDFDLDSMINITVLSDIKTIRQDFHQQASQMSQQGGNRLKPASKYSRDSNKKQGQENRNFLPANSMRPLITRSRTVTEFNYRGNYQSAQSLSSDQGGRSRVPVQSGRAGSFINSPDSTSLYQPTGYGSIPSTYDWQYEGQQRFGHVPTISKLAERSSDISPLVKTQQSKPQDEKAAKIIETFKAQVLARAASLPVARTKSIELQRSVERISKKTSKEQQTNLADTTTKEPSDERQKNSNGEEKKAQPERIDAALPKEEDSSQKGSKIPVATSKISNIPRLISLHLKTPKSDETVPKSPEEAKKPTQASEKANPISKSSAISSKFVSQYRLLRGKSLADELGEQASSK